ncbi:uncharacterized protein LOC117147755 [Drosophila mauritiana]|uniref:Uncharacterized protein LOC117147755 n=1 Tax=Drosophila mauritiana TaxID=7226 RepID=A0A6P8KVE5_DROMA|nr:uncharacterized protein LOC117147755 [Drosophila mauritiana]
MKIFEGIGNQFCRVVRNNLNIPLSFCETRSVWKFSSSREAMVFFCALGFGILGVILHFIGFMNLFFGAMRLGPIRILTNKNFLMLTASLLVIYAMVFIKPCFIYPFLVLSGIILTIDLFVLVLDIVRRVRIPLDRKVTIWNMMLNLCFVVYVQAILNKQD